MRNEKGQFVKGSKPANAYGKGHIPYWKGGITPLRKKLYFSKKYKQWRKDIFGRDNFACQCCGVVGGELNADHIRPWAFFPELRFDINNGRTLCVNCHRKTETWGNRVVGANI